MSIRRAHARIVIFATILSILGLIAQPGCGTDAIPIIDAAVPPDFAEPPVVETARLISLRSVRWPGGGRELTIGILDDATGRPFAADLSARISVAPTSGQEVRVAAARHEPAPGYTAVLLPEARSKEERAALAKAIGDFAAMRPAVERIALYRHGAAVQMMSGFVADRAELGEALGRYRDGVDDAKPLPLKSAVDLVASDLREVGGPAPDVMRALVVVSDYAPAAGDAAGVLVVGAVPGPAGLAAAAEAIEEARTGAFYRVSICGPIEKLDARLRVVDMRGVLQATLGATLPEETGAACDVGAIETAKRRYTARIELVFDDAQRAAHDARIRAATRGTTFNEALARSEFETQVRLAPGQPTILATAQLHGQGSLRCDRKSYLLQLTGPDRHLLAGSATDEILLMSMCDDPAYVYAPTAYRLFADDLFPIQHRFVELVIDGRSRGVYLLVEKTREELVRDQARVTAVLRRAYPKSGRDAFEVDYPTTGDPAGPPARWGELEKRIATLSGDALVAALREKLDLDQYLRWLAAQTILKSGDYIDEVFFVATEQADGKGGVGEGYRIMPWDPEGYTTCHLNSTLAWVDPRQIAYCAESRLDHKILPDAKVYAMFVAKIEEGLRGWLARDRVAAALARTRTDLQAQLVNPALCSAMIELRTLDAGSADCAVARSVVGKRADAILAAYDARRAFLLDRIAAYRAGN